MVIGHPKTPLLLELNPWWYVGLWRVFWVKWPFIAISSPSRMQRQLIYTPLHLYSTPRVAKRTTYFAREHNTMTQPEIAPQTSEAESTPQPLGHLASQEQEEQIITPDLFILWINTGSSSFKVAVNIFCITGASFVGIYPVLTWREIEKKMKIKERKEKRKGMILVTSVSEQDLIHVLQCSHGL